MQTDISVYGIFKEHFQPGIKLPYKITKDESIDVWKETVVKHTKHSQT